MKQVASCTVWMHVLSNGLLLLTLGLTVLISACSDDVPPDPVKTTVPPGGAPAFSTPTLSASAIVPSPTSTFVSPIVALPTAASALPDSELRNASYPSELSPVGRVQLANGEFVASTPLGELRITLLDVRGLGQLDPDALPDAAVILMSKTQGTSGTFYELSAVLNQGGQANSIASSFLGDRIIINSLEVSNHQITINMRVQGPNDGACCPTLGATRVYALNNGNLVLMSKTD